MPTIDATCPTDKKVTLVPRGCRLFVRIPGNTTLEWFCPKCHAYLVQPVDQQVFHQLGMLGVEVVAIEVPDEATEPHPEPAISPAEADRMIAEFARMISMPTMPAPRRPALMRLP